MRHTTKLKRIMAERRAVTVPGAANAMFAKVIESAGFETVYLTGAGLANMSLAMPDIGLTTMTEIATTLAAVADAVEIPIIVDADTGFGNPLNMIRCTRVFERAGAAAMHIEDQVFPKRCGHFSGKQVVPLGEMLDKIKAAVDSRHDQDFQIIARTDARAIDGLDSALERAHAFIEAGADSTFVEAPVNEAEMKRIAGELSVPQFANIVFGGKTPDPGREKLAAMGFSIVLYANAVLQAALRASFEVLGALKEQGSLDTVAGKLATFEERQKAVAKDWWDAQERRFKAD